MYRDVWVFIDVDGTLIDKDDCPRPYVAEFFRRIRQLKHVRIVVWSAGQAGNRGAALGEYARRKIESIDRKLETDIRSMVDEYLWKGTPFIVTGRQFYVDDMPDLLFAKAKDGHGTFRVPFYEASLDHRQNDPWLLQASRAIEDFVWSEHAGVSGARDPDNGAQSETPSQDVGEGACGSCGKTSPKDCRCDSVLNSLSRGLTVKTSP